MEEKKKLHPAVVLHDGKMYFLAKNTVSLIIHLDRA